MKTSCKELRCQETKIGKLCGSPVIAVTDDAGSNVIVGGSEHIHWLLSPDCKNHADAIDQAKKLVEGKQLPDIYTDMRGPDAESRSLGFLLIASCRSRR